MLDPTERNALLRDFILSLATRDGWQSSLDASAASLASITAGGALRDVRRVLVVAHGTSLATSQLIASWIAHIARVDATAVPAFTFAEYPDDVLLAPEATLVIGVSCGGNTKSVVNALEAANQRGARTLIITGRHRSDSVEVAKWWLQSSADLDRSTPTPVYSVSHLHIAAAGYLLAVALGEANGCLDAARASQWRDDLDTAIGSLSVLPELFDEMREISRGLPGIDCVAVLGTGPNFGTATEGALKISEFSWVFGAAEELEDFAHGRFREADEHLALFVIAPAGPTIAKTKDVLVGCATSQTPAIVLTDAPDAALNELSWRTVHLPQAPNEYLTPFLYIFPLWFYGWHRMNDDGGVVGEKRHGLLAADIDFQKHYDENGIRRTQPVG